MGERVAHSPPREEGCPSHQDREKGEGGVVALHHLSECVSESLRTRPPRPLPQRWLRTIFLMSRPPLLTRRGIPSGIRHRNYEHQYLVSGSEPTTLREDATLGRCEDP